MRRLRSPWTIVALVPVFFLAGFTVVSAMVDRGGDGGAEPAAQPVATGADERPAAIVTGSDAAGDDPAVPAEPEPASDDPAEVEEEDGAAPRQGPPPVYVPPPAPDDSGAPPPGPPKGVIDIDYGDWGDRFQMRNTKLVESFGSATVTGQFRYLGGGKCRAANVEVRGLFYDEERDPVGQGFWETDWAVGVSGLPVDEWLEMEVYGMVRHRATSATVRVFKVTCR